MGAKTIYDSVGQILGLKYRFKIISHVIKAGVKRFWSNPAFSKNKERYA